MTFSPSSELIFLADQQEFAIFFTLPNNDTRNLMTGGYWVINDDDRKHISFTQIVGECAKRAGLKVPKIKSLNADGVCLFHLEPYHLSETQRTILARGFARNNGARTPEAIEAYFARLGEEVFQDSLHPALGHVIGE